MRKLAVSFTEHVVQSATALLNTWTVLLTFFLQENPGAYVMFLSEKWFLMQYVAFFTDIQKQCLKKLFALTQ